MKRKETQDSSSRSSTTNGGRSSSAQSRQSSRVKVDQTPIDAQLDEEFEESERGFDYSSSINLNMSNSTSNVPSDTVSAYLQKMQRGRLIQPFGCLIAIEEESFKVVAYSENAQEMLDLAQLAVPSMGQQEALAFGMDVRGFFRSSGAAALQKAANHPELNLLNPILVHCKTSGKPFYAILHRIDVGLVLDLEPVNMADLPLTATGALTSYKIAAKAISKLQSVPSGSINLLCDLLVNELRDLTGYDRVMVYRFHEDEHGEVIAESVQSGLEPYLGLHYPATDIPQASRFLFMKNKVRMICDCLAPSIMVTQDKNLADPINLSGSTLRAPHGCHAQYMANMGSIASLVMSVIINDTEDGNEMESDQQMGRKLWGLVVCHHQTARFVPFPLRYACEFLIQVFGVQINKEVELEAQKKEKHVIQTQTVLCDMLLRDAPVAIMTQSPNVMDLVKCDGAALLYRKKCWLLGVSPTETQITDLAAWLLEYHGDSTGLTTDSVMEAGYPGASDLASAICGMAAIRITSKDFLFWFRSHTAKEIKWGGAKHDPGDKDGARKMNPRSSFKAFLEVVKWRSLPWEDLEMDAIHSLQLILKGSVEDEAVDNSKVIVTAPVPDNRIQRVDELRRVTNEMVRVIETAAAPIFAVDVLGCINGWNSKAAELTGLAVEQAIGMPLVHIVEGNSVDVVKNMLSLASRGIEEKNMEITFRTFDPKENKGPVYVVVSVCCNRDIKGDMAGICFVGQDLTGQKMVMDRYKRFKGDYLGIVRNQSALIPPIFMSDEHGKCLEWNEAMQKLSGLKREDAIGRLLLGEVFTVNNSGCRVKDQDTLTKLRILLNGALAGQDSEPLLFGLFDKYGKPVDALVNGNARTDAEGRVSGVLFFLYVPSRELQYAWQVQKISEQAAATSLNKLTYIRHEAGKGLNGLRLMQNLMERTDLSEEQKQLLKTSTLCREQLTTIINDTDIGKIEDLYLELRTVEFNLGEVLDVVVKQAMKLSQDRKVEIARDFPAELSFMNLYGDNLRLQQVLADFLANSILFTPALNDSSVVLKVVFRKECMGVKVQIVHLEFRISHPAPGFPEDLVREMFHSQGKGSSREGLGLYMSHKLVKTMNGNVQYLREAESSSFIILIAFPLVTQTEKPSREKELS
ncbi:Phytochrome C [Linum perenne]